MENDWLDAIVQLPSDSFYNTPITTYIWIIDKAKPLRNPGRVILIDASKCYTSRRKNIGSKRVDISQKCRDMITKVYGNYVDGIFEDTSESGDKIIVKSKVVESIEFGYKKIVVETPKYDEKGNIIRKKDKPVPDTSKRDTEQVPLDKDIEEFFESEVKPYNSDAWIDLSKTKIGYEIPFSRTFYEYKTIEPAEIIASRIEEHEKKLVAKLHEMFKEL